MGKITEEDITKAYRYLKNFLFYDKTALFARYKLAEFEYEIQSDKNLGIKQILSNKEAISKKLDEINVKFIPKTVVDGTKNDKDTNNNASEDEIRFFTNDISNQKIKIEKYNYLIDAPIEIYIISVLWLMKVAPKFSNNISNDNYAYQFRIGKDKNKTDNSDNPNNPDGISLYQPYFCGYQKWRDNALSKVNELVSSGNDATLIGLDIQRYFYNIQLDLKNLLSDESKHKNLEKGEDYARLTELLCKIHKRYTEKVNDIISKIESNSNKEISKCKANQTMLPLGLPSSGFIANLYLADFDRRVHEELNPDYYGRYVDDILIVLKNCKCDNVHDFIESKLQKKHILGPAPEEENMEGKTPINNYYLIDHKNLKIQKKKVIVQHLNHNGSKAVINSFMRKIRENSSEFNRLPDEDEVFSDFEDEAFELEQDGSHNKLRDIKTFKSNKFGASKFLSKRILFANILPDKEGKSKKESSLIIQFFKGTTGIDNYALWPKVATYFIVKNDQQALLDFYKSINSLIDKIEPNDKDSIYYNEIKPNLQLYLKLSIATPLALNPEFVSKNEISGKTKNDIEFIRDQALKFRKSNMFQHDLIAYSLFNYTEEFEQEFKKTEECDSTFTNLLSASKILSKISDKEPKFSESMMNFSPRVVKLHEVCNFYEYSFVINKKENSTSGRNSSNNNKMKLIRECFEKFLNNSNLSDSLLDKSFSIRHPDNTSPLKNKDIVYISIKDNNREICNPTCLRVAVSNTKISEDTIRNHRIGKAEYCEKDIRNIFKIVNEAISNKADLLVLPEWCMPYRLFNIIANKCIKNDMALITGMKYTFDKDNYAYNKVATILPLKIHSFSNAFITFRQKNHLAPKEDLALQAYGYSKPLKTNDVYYHYQWHNAYFAVYNCFELADIVDRSLFKSKIDFIVATELNKDIHYYSDIVGATVRDLHCYFIQANSSTWGDSRITEPSKHDTRDLVRVKGGINPSVLIEDIDLSKLREFQIQEYVGQEANKDFKFTPPNFDKKNVKKRIDDEPIIKD